MTTVAERSRRGPRARAGAARLRIAETSWATSVVGAGLLADCRLGVGGRGRDDRGGHDYRIGLLLGDDGRLASRRSGVVSTAGGVSAATGSLAVASTGVDRRRERRVGLLSGHGLRLRQSSSSPASPSRRGRQWRLDVSSRSTVTVFALTVLVGLRSPLTPRIMVLANVFRARRRARPEGASVPGLDGADGR